MSDVDPALQLECQAVFDVTWKCIEAAQAGNFDRFEQVYQHKALNAALDSLVAAAEQRGREKRGASEKARVAYVKLIQAELAAAWAQVEALREALERIAGGEDERFAFEVAQATLDATRRPSDG